MFPTTPEQWAHFLGALGVKPVTAARWAEPFAEECRPECFNLRERELDDYVAEVLHETDFLSATVENLNYKAPRIRELGAIYGPASRWGKAAREADTLAGCPEDLAEVLYGGRFGNTQQGDGWKFRGRGIPMVTFRANYARLGDLMGQDLTVTPEILEQPRYAVAASLHWWADRIPDSAIDYPDRVRRLVQGSTLGLDRTRQLSAKARAALGSLA